MGGLPREQGLSAAADAQSLISGDPNVGVVLIVVATTPQLEDKVKSWGEAAIASGTPTAILLTPGTLVDGARAALREIGCPYTDRMDDALRVIRASIEYGRILKHGEPERAPAPDFVDAVQTRLGTLPHGQLTELETKSLLRSAGIPTTEDRLADNVEAAIAAAGQLGYPVVMKAVCRELIHKSDIGAVKLDLAHPAAVREAWNDIVAGVTRHLPHAQFDGCAVQEMASGGVELILGAKWDAQFGAIVMVGAGGVLVEVMDDVALALAPLSHRNAAALLERIQAWPLLTGVRGRGACDVDALADALMRLSWLAHALGPRLQALDVNPLLVRSDGVLALDARATLGQAVRPSVDIA